MNFPADIFSTPGKTLFMVAGNPQAALVTRAGKKMRRCTVSFSNPHTALDWCLQRAAIFVLLPRSADNKLN